MLDRCKILDVQFSPSVADEQLRTLIMRTALLAAFVNDFPTAPISDFCHVNADRSENGPVAVMKNDGVVECLRLFGGGWNIEDSEELGAVGHGESAGTWKAEKMVNGVTVQFFRLDLASACYLMGGLPTQ